MRQIFSIFFVLIFLQSCGNNSNNSSTPISKTNPNGRYVSTQQYIFTTNVNPTTFKYAQDVLAELPLGSQIVLANSYVINNTSDLNNLISYNLVGLTSYLTSINDLNTYSYFLIEDVQCPEYTEYFVESYENSTLTIGMHIFILSNEPCPALVGLASYSVYKALKAS
jgi:hypothetical protein